MRGVVESAFDCIASRYDELWTNTPIGSNQRRAVWNRIDGLFEPGQSVVDIGCGTGVDAQHLRSCGVRVYGIDPSPRMVLATRRRQVPAECSAADGLDRLPMDFDGALSNFGALNCVPSLEPIAAALARKVRRGGYVALCFIGTLCVWEMLHYLRRAEPRRAFRRFHRKSTASLGIDVFYFSRRAILSAFADNFRFLASYGIGLFVPPSYVEGLSAPAVTRLASMDRVCAHWPVLRGLADHRLYVFERI